MSIFTERQINIISLVYESKEILTGKSIANSLGVSLRTLQMEIAEINKNNLVINSSNKGYIYNLDISNKFEPSAYIRHEQDDDKYILNILAKELLFPKTILKIGDLADRMYISISTLERQIKKLSKIIKDYDLQIKIKKTEIMISGNEYNKQKYIKHLINAESSPNFSLNQIEKTYLNGIDAEFIKSITSEAVKKHNYYFDKFYSDKIYLNILIAIYRMHSNSYIITIPFKHKVNSNSVEYLIASEICTEYTKQYSVNPKKHDIEHIAILLVGLIKPRNNVIGQQESIDPIKEDFMSKIKCSLYEVFGYFSIDINIDDDFIYNFALHIDSLVKRAKNEQFVENALLDNLKVTVPFIYEISVQLSRILSKMFNINLLDEEIGYIAIHIGSLMESSLKSYDTLKVVIVGTDYKDITRNITNSLKKIYMEEIDVIGITQQVPIEGILSKADLIISTFPLLSIGIENITISPLYTKEDQKIIDQAIHKSLQNKKEKEKYTMNLPYFEDNLFLRIEEDITKHEVIILMAETMRRLGFADESFVDSVLEREKISSTCFFDSFAIPHAVNFNARKTKFCVLVSKKGINWDDNLIKIVLMITVHPNDKSNFDMIYSGLIKSLCDKEKLAEMSLSKSMSEFLSHIKM